MTLKNNRAPLLCCFQLCAWFHCHMSIQTGVRVRKRLSWALTSVTLTFDLWPWPFAWTSLLTMVITPENFMMIRWWEHGEKGVTEGRTDRQTDGLNQSYSCLVAAKNKQSPWCNSAQCVIKVRHDNVSRHLTSKCHTRYCSSQRWTHYDHSAVLLIHYLKQCWPSSVMPYGNTRGKWKGHNNNGYPFIYWDWTKFFWTQTYIERIAEQTEVFDPDKPVWHGTQVHQESTEYLQ